MSICMIICKTYMCVFSPFLSYARTMGCIRCQHIFALHKQCTAESEAEIRSSVAEGTQELPQHQHMLALHDTYSTRSHIGLGFKQHKTCWGGGVGRHTETALCASFAGHSRTTAVTRGSQGLGKIASTPHEAWNGGELLIWAAAWAAHRVQEGVQEAELVQQLGAQHIARQQQVCYDDRLHRQHILHDKAGILRSGVRRTC